MPIHTNKQIKSTCTDRNITIYIYKFKFINLTLFLENWCFNIIFKTTRSNVAWILIFNKNEKWKFFSPQLYIILFHLKHSYLRSIPVKNWAISSLEQPKGRPRNLTTASLMLGESKPARLMTHSISPFFDRNTANKQKGSLVYPSTLSHC